MSCPSSSSAIGVAGCAATASSYASKPGTLPPIMKRCCTPGMRSTSSAAVRASACEVMNAFAPQSATMYAISSGSRCCDTGVQ
jgi:hypothetical protein